MLTAPELFRMALEKGASDMHLVVGHRPILRVTGELYDLEKDPFELKNLIRSRAHAAIRDRLHRDLKVLVAEAVGL
jgi:Tfp pilus assembly pilus retraction ATPase PilT